MTLGSVTPGHSFSPDARALGTREYRVLQSARDRSSQVTPFLHCSLFELLGSRMRNSASLGSSLLEGEPIPRNDAFSLSHTPVYRHLTVPHNLQYSSSERER